MNISFGAKLVDTTSIMTLTHPDARDYKDCNVSIVELSRFDRNDWQTVEDTAKKYSSYDTKSTNYAQNIRFFFDNVFKNPKQRKNELYYAMTLQQDKFEKLDHEKVLALMETLTDKAIYDHNPSIEYLQVSPSTNHEAKSITNPRLYRNIGSKMVNFAKKLFEGKEIYVVADYNSIDFYLKNGFKKVRGNLLKFCG